jgi:amidase
VAATDRARSDANHPAGMLGARASDIAAAVRGGEVTATEVVAAHLDQIASVEHRLGAYVEVLRQEAVDAAAALDARPDRSDLPLAGVPLAVKDVAEVTGHPTRHGCRGTSAQPAAGDHRVVARLRAAGAIVVGITRCSELSIWGTSDDPDGTAVSPWQPTRTAGGSSGGSAAAVAAGTAALGLASDGLGSVRIPAACCGLFGIKPGEGVAPVSNRDGTPHWFGMSRFGPVATSVGDAALGLAALADRPDLAEVRIPAGPLKVAVSWAPPAPGVTITRPWIDATIEAGRLLRSVGHEVRRADPPYHPRNTQALMLRWTQGAAKDVAELVEDPAVLQPRTRVHAQLGERLAERFPVEESQAQRWKDDVDAFLDEDRGHDVLLTPMFNRLPPTADAWHRRSWAANFASNSVAYSWLPGTWNLADVPAATVPIGGHRGQPLAVQIVGRRGGEATVLGVAADLERLVRWPRHAPAWGIPA